MSLINTDSTIIDISSSGNNTVITGVSGEVIRIWKLFFVCNAAVNITFRDGASDNLTGVMNFLANGSMVLDFDQEPWYVLTSGNDFVINLSAGQQVSGRVYFTRA